MPVINHIHKYYLVILGGDKIVRENGKKKLVKTGGYPVFKCSGCSSMIARSLALGTKTICWRCEQEMTMKAYNISETKPHHKECRRKLNV